MFKKVVAAYEILSTKESRDRYDATLVNAAKPAEPDWAAERKKAREKVLKAVRMDGLALKTMSPVFSSDREVVLAAVTDTWKALEFVSPALRTDAEIVLIAVQQSWRALEFAPRADRSAVLAAVRQSAAAVQHAA